MINEPTNSTSTTFSRVDDGGRVQDQKLKISAALPAK